VKVLPLSGRNPAVSLDESRESAVITALGVCKVAGFFYVPAPYSYVGGPALVILLGLWFGGAFIPPD
jgi:hypothetical protein